MKKFTIILSGVLALLIAAGLSCKKLQDTQPLDRFDDASVWSTKANAMTFVNGVYASVLNLYTNYVSDEVWTGNIIQSDGNAFTRGQITRDDDYGFNQFSTVRNCNIIIEKATTSTNLSAGDQAELIAQGKFLRAMTYYWLARRFGRVVYVDRVLTEDEPTFALPQTANIAETYTLIMKDINECYPDMPAEAAPGLAGKLAVMALKSEVALQAAAYTDDNTYYQQAIDAADTVILSGKAPLETDYEGMFNERKRFSTELLLALYRDKSNTTCDAIQDMQECIPNVNNDDVHLRGATPAFKVDKTFECWGRFSPTQNLIDDYLVIDAANPTRAVKWNESSQFTANVAKRGGSAYLDSGVVTTGISLNTIMYANRDKRLTASVVLDSTTWFGELVTMNRNGNLNRLIKGSLNNFCCTQVTNTYFRKGMYNVSPRPFYGVPTDYHWVIFRAGRVYLNKAEALLRLNKISEAVDALNMTRTIHGGLPPSAATSITEAWTDYKRERRVELFKEKDYYWSLLRWGKYGGPANRGAAPGGKIPELLEKPNFMEINVNRDGYRIETINFSQNDQRDFDETRRYLLPIQNSQIVRHGSLAQNPNW